MLNVFLDEWRECLRAHYMHVARTNDPKTLISLLTVMQEVGFGEEELRELRVLATAHVDDVADNFVPDLNILQREAELEIEPDMELEAESEPELEAELETELEPQPTVKEKVPEANPAQDDPKNPKQLSLF